MQALVLVPQHLNTIHKKIDFAQNTYIYVFAHNFFSREKKFDKMHHWIPDKILYKKDYIVNFSKFFSGWPEFSTG